MKLYELMNARATFLSVDRKGVSSKTIYKMLKFLKDGDTAEALYKEKYDEIINTFGNKDKEGKLIVGENNSITFSENNEGECKKSLAELGKTEIDKPNILFTIDELNELNLSIQQLTLLFNFIKEE